MFKYFNNLAAIMRSSWFQWVTVGESRRTWRAPNGAWGSGNSVFRRLLKAPFLTMIYSA